MTMNPHISGLHHVTAITADGQRNVDFYAGVLGLRMIKCTVNFDDPGSYHLYYGDGLGRPGTVMTFFVWEGGRPGRVGPPQAVATQFVAPTGSLDFWTDHLQQHGVPCDPVRNLFGDDVLTFYDPDGMALELVAATKPPPADTKWDSPIPVDHAIRGFYGVTLASTEAAQTGALLGNIMGLAPGGAEAGRHRYVGDAERAAIVDVLSADDQALGYSGTGTVHHIAFRVPDDQQQRIWQSILQARGFSVSPVMDRCYFHSIYFKEPGGVLFELATDGPGFTADEPEDCLGTALKLPAWLEKDREQIEKRLPARPVPR